MNLKEIIAVLREAAKITAEKRLAKADSDERAAIAKAFNDRYTYRFISKADNKHAWMCPECNRVHSSIGFDPFIGMQFPGCCKAVTGHRFHENIRTQ